MSLNDAPRLILLAIFCISVFMLGQNWFREYGPKPQQTPASNAPDVTASLPKPTIPTEAAPGVPVAPGQAGAAPEAADATAQIVTVRTDVMRAEISTIGGELRRVELLKYGDTEDPSKPFTLLETGGRHTYLAQSGLIGTGLPTHKSRFSAEREAYELAEGTDQVVVTLTATEAQGAKVVKTLTFHRGTYVVDVGYTVVNQGAAPLAAHAYYQLSRDDKAPVGDSRWVHTFTGVAAYTDRDKYKKIDFSDIEKGKAAVPKESQDGWIGMVQHYFVSAWLPPAGTVREFFTRALGNGMYAAGVIIPTAAIPPGESGTWTVPLYVGPQDQDRLAELAPGLNLTVDYGWLTIIASPLFWILSAIQSVVVNWGVAIILLTVLIKLVFFPLSAASYKSMAKMRVMAPKLQKLKEQYGDDRQRLHQAMMELYKTEKINPLGGCLPIVVQIPVFIALYWVLLGSVELRQAPFVLWVKDLSRPDPWYVLPVLMGISMIIQTRLNPEPPDPVQAKVMKIMPIAFSVFFFFFPAGLVLYWLVNNVLSIAQQWAINRQLERVGLGHAKR